MQINPVLRLSGPTIGRILGEQNGGEGSSRNQG